MRARDDRTPLRGLVAATSFLTWLPLGRLAGRVREEDLRAGAPWFPMVGAAVGLIAAATGWLVSLRAPAALAAMVVVAAETIATGVLHLDGLADAADGLGASSTGRDGLRAMRDPGIGVFGVTAVALDLGLRITAVAALLASGSFPWAIVAAASAARLAPLALAAWLPYLRDGGGTGRWVRDGPRPSTIAFGAGTVLLVCTLTGPAVGAVTIATLAVVTLAVGMVARRRFGGVTGDLLGASAELGQTIALAAVVVVLGP